MDEKVLNKRKGDENCVLAMYEYSTTSNRMCLFIRMRQDLCRSFLIETKRFHVYVSSLLTMFIKDITYTAMSASSIDFHLIIDREGRL